MKLEELYTRPIQREVNPSVSATSHDSETEKTEIEEYVFTDEILNGFYKVLDAIKNKNKYKHIGIWIDGYYGSGKSHFLKYLDYCFLNRTKEFATSRLLEAVKAIDPLDDTHNIDFDYHQMDELVKWVSKATIETLIFNLETTYDHSVDIRESFLQVFWSEFNENRGLNKFNFSLAQHLEKPLEKYGVFQEFKDKMKEEGADWENQTEAADLVDNELDFVLDIATKLAPRLDRESIRERIVRRDTNMSIERFAKEVASFLKDKDENYRLIFLADEVSQFINKGKDRYLNLQEIVTKLSEECSNKVWIACTSQQDLSEILDDCDIAEEKDKEGKIMGRFEVKVSLKGTQPEVITQKRILDKNERAKLTLKEFYNEHNEAFGLFFKLPNSYEGFASEKVFIDYYPFVPYQFQLIKQVFNSFLNLGYVVREVKGNERSIIKVVHATAKATAEDEVGKFISFDELYNSMFSEGLQGVGQKAVENAVNMAKTYKDDPRLAVRVANVLFMICNISPTDKLIFPSSLDNVATLLVSDLRTTRHEIKDKVKKILDFLCESNIIRLEQGKNGAPDTYSFYSEEQMKVANLIDSITPDNNKQAEVLREIFFKYITKLTHKVKHHTRSLSVGATILRRNFLSTNNPNIVVDFVMDTDYVSPELFASKCNDNCLSYFIGSQLYDNRSLFHDFRRYCRINTYMETTPIQSDENMRARKDFEHSAQDMYDKVIVPGFRKILDTCPIIAGKQVIDEFDLAGRKGNDRFSYAMDKHLSLYYSKASLVASLSLTNEKLKKEIERPITPEEYEGERVNLTAAEREVEIYLGRNDMEDNVADVTTKFLSAPYGWDELCTLYVINELVRRRKRDYSYGNNPNVDIQTVASHIITEKSRFTLHQAKGISPQVVQQFIKAWKDIFGVSASFNTNDDSSIFRICHGNEGKNSLYELIENYHAIEEGISSYPFSETVKQTIELLKGWLEEREPLCFFNKVIEEQTKARVLVDKCKEIESFKQDNLATYKNIRKFIDENKSNFTSIKPEDHSKVAELLGIENDTWPLDSIRKYSQLQDYLKRSLDVVREEIRQKIDMVYRSTYHEIESVLNEQSIDIPHSILADCEEVIKVKTTPTDLSILKSNLTTDEFYNQEIGKILDYVEEHTQSTEEDTKTDDGERIPPQGKIHQLSLKTKTTQPISNEKDIDRYLDGLRSQLRQMLNDCGRFMITK